MAGSDLVQSLTRGLLILEALAASRDGLTLQELATRLDVRPPTAHNLLRTLAAKKYVERRSNPLRYILGSTAVDLAQRHRTRDLLKTASEVLLDAAKTAPQCVLTLAQLHGGEVTAVLRVSPEQPGTVQHPASQIMNPYTSASSLLFQAFLPPDDRESYRRHYPFSEYGGAGWRSLEQLDRFLAESRKLGHVHLADATLYRAAAPVFSDGRELIAATGVSSHSQSHHGKLAERIAHRIEEQLRKGA